MHPLKAFRKAHVPALTQKDLADLLGVSRVVVTRWESGERKIPAEMLWDIFTRTGIRPEALRPDLSSLFSVV